MHCSLHRALAPLARLFIAVSLLFSLVTQVTASAPISTLANTPTHKPELVKDIQTMNSGTYITSFTALDSSFFFLASDGVHGSELWVSQGTAETTHMVKDIAPGSASSNPGLLTRLDNNRLIFTATDPASGTQIWVSDGTEPGTQPVTDFVNASIALYYRPVSVNGQVYLVIGGTLWRTNGRKDGTVQVSSLSLSSLEFAAYNGWLYFAANGPQGNELYRTRPDTLEPVLVKDLCPANINCGAGSPGDSYPYSLVGAADRLYFVARDETHGQAIWYTMPDSNGGPDAVSLVADLEGLSISGRTYSLLTPVDGGLFFIGSDGISGDELWYSGGAPESIHQVADLEPGSGVSYYGNMLPLGNALYFTHRSYSTNKTTFYRTTGNGVEELNGPLNMVSPPVRVGSLIYFLGNTAPSGSDLWRLNEDDSLQMAVTFPATPYGTSIVGVWQNNLILIYADPIHSIEPWISDGTQAGTHLLKDIATQYKPYSDLPDLTMIYRGAVYFQASSGFDNSALWRSDGNEAGTQRVAGFTNDWLGLQNAAVVHDRLYFNAPTSQNSYGGLWRTDGTEPGIQPVFDGEPRRFLTAGDRLFFLTLGSPYASTGLWVLNQGDSSPTFLAETDWNFTQMGALGDEALLVRYRTTSDFQGAWDLLRTDGTPEGTHRIYGPVNSTVSSNAGYSYSSLKNMVAFDGRLFFVAPMLDGSFAFGLYAYDGKTVTLVTADQGAPQDPTPQLVAGDNLYFGGLTDSAVALWRLSKGSTVAQVMFSRSYNIYEYPTLQIPRPLVDWNGRVVFYNEQPNVDSKLWLSDGTPEGTAPFCPSCGYKITTYGRPLAVQGKLYFAASDTHGLYGNELWESDGTESGTHLLADINPGPDSSNPGSLILLGQRLLFVANDGLDSSKGGHGYELWRYDLQSTIYLPAIMSQ